MLTEPAKAVEPMASAKIVKIFFIRFPSLKK
jgi:hypothetical protein